MPLSTHIHKVLRKADNVCMGLTRTTILDNTIRIALFVDDDQVNQVAQQLYELRKIADSFNATISGVQFSSAKHLERGTLDVLIITIRMSDNNG